ncbi:MULTISPECIES: hypothetical protein [Micromonospora]|uniref:hypothetical protein n=1 Tax=Micromonospora TaxID=1873 RepID=UPI0024A2BA93|nr:hypothetical protein [Micromonospora sp. NBRC 107095]GLZ62335.1 hypothetical protein Misp05_59110 [Micromonospora sp. NBRC 107095]
MLEVVFESGILGFSSGTAGGIADAYRRAAGPAMEHTAGLAHRGTTRSGRAADRVASRVA